MADKLDYVILDLLQSTARNLKAQPLNLGGVSGIGGGAGGPPGGFIGWLPQTRVAYDEDELATLATSGTPSLLDNLNHIRYRLGTVESGAGTITVIDDTTPATYTTVDTIHFSGGVVVTNLGGGDVRVNVTASGGGDATYLRLDTSNDPLTDQLQIINATPGNGGIYLQTEGDSYTLDIEQYNSTQNGASSPMIFGYRESTNSKSNSAYMLDMWESVATGGTITGGFLRLKSKGSDRLVINPNITDTSGTSAFIDTNTTMLNTGKLLSLRNAGSEGFYVTGSGVVNTVEYYQVDGVQVVSNRVIDARIDDTINSGDATTDGVITAIRDALIAHGLISAS